MVGGISVYLNGDLVSITEYTSDDNKIRTIVYTHDNDEPVSIIDYKEKGDNE